MVKVFIDSDGTNDEELSAKEEQSFDTLMASRYSFFSPAILQKFLSITLSKNKTLTPFCNIVYATILFADISGFTRLSSHINVESLKKHINLFFTTLLGVVKDFNGDVIKFCGDAVMIMWPVDSTASHSVKAATAYLAASCAIRLISHCGTYSRQEKGYKVSLRLHCGIGSGAVNCMCLGEKDRWEFLIAGDPLRQVGLAESEAGIGEVCMSEESYALVADKFEATEMPEGSRNLILTKPTKKPKTNAVNDQVNATPERVQVPLESDLLNKLTYEQSRLSVGTSSEDGQPDREISDGSKSNMSNGTNITNGTHGTNGTNVGSGRSVEHSPTVDNNSDHKGDHTPLFRSGLQQYTIYESKQSIDDRDTITPLIERPSLEKSPLSVATPIPTPKRQSFFSPIFSQSPSISHYDTGFDREFKRSISQVKSYLSDFLCPNYLPPPIIVPYLHKFLMSPAKMSIENDTLSYLAELRDVVTIFIEILGLEDDFNMGFIRRPQKVISIVLDCLDRFSGSLRQYVVDDKGCVIIAAFGLPGSSHEDNCVRAIEAATAIRDGFAEVKIDCRIGITQGRVYCGLVGSDDRCEYAMMGSSVNLAARLMSKGESSQILVNQDVQTATEKLFKFYALQKIKAKGYVRPVAVFIPFERIHTHELAVHKNHLDSVEMNNIMSFNSEVDENKNKSLIIKENKKLKFIGRETELATFKKSLEIFANSQDEKLQLENLTTTTTNNNNNIIGINTAVVNTATAIISSERNINNINNNGNGNRLITNGSHQAHIVEGQAGAGKTWFIQEIIKMVKKMPAIKKIYICATPGQTQKSSQYYIIGQLMEQIFGISFMNNTINNASRNSNSINDTKKNTPKGGNKNRQDSINLSIKDDIIHWFEINDPDGRVISSKLTFRVNETPIISESIKINPLRKSFLVRSQTITKISRQYQKASSTDPISDLDLAISPQISKKNFLHIPKDNDSFDQINNNNSEKNKNNFDNNRSEEIVETKSFHYSELLPLLSEILPIQIEDNAFTSNLLFTERMTYCENLVMHIFEVALERQKTFLVVENLHWCDSGSLTYLSHWLKRKNGCFFLCTTRTSSEKTDLKNSRDYDDNLNKNSNSNINGSNNNNNNGGNNINGSNGNSNNSATNNNTPTTNNNNNNINTTNNNNNTANNNNQMRQKRRGSRYDAPKVYDSDTAHILNEICQQCASTALHFFSVHEISKLLATTLDPNLLAQYPLILNHDNIEKILKHTDGSPFLTHILIVELEDALRKGIFKNIDDLPSGPDGLILNRFDKLSTKDQIILKVASVLGQTFTLNELYSVLYRLGNITTTQNLLASLEGLVNSNLISHVDEADRQPLFLKPPNDGIELTDIGTSTYSFVNKSIQDGIYYLMLEGQRKLTHNIIGNLIEEKIECSGPNPALYMAATNHFWRSDNPTKKYEFLTGSAYIAKSKNDNYTANNCYGELIFMKTDKNVGDLLASCTDVITRDQRKRDLWGVLSNVKITFAFGSKRYMLHKQESMKNLLDTDGFGTDRKWLKVKELKSRFQLREDFSERVICMWIGEVAIARFNLGDFRAAHNLFILALYNAHLPLPYIEFIEKNSFIRELYSSPFHISTDIVKYVANVHLSQSLHSSSSLPPEIREVELNFVQCYLYLSIILFLHGNLEVSIYLIHKARGLLSYVSCSAAELLTTEIKIIALQAVSCHYRGNISRSNNLLHLLEQKCLNSVEPSHISIKLISNGMINIFCGRFKDARIKLKKSVEILGMLSEGLLQHMISLNLGWSLFLSGRLSEAQLIITNVMSYAMSTDNIALSVWTYQLDMLMKVFAGEFGKVEMLAAKVKNISRKDIHSSGTSAILGLSLIMQRKFDQALSHIRYACGKLSKRNHVFLHGYVLLFISLSSALCILKMQQNIPRQLSSFECLLIIIRDGISILHQSSLSHGILKLLTHSLILQSINCINNSDLYTILGLELNLQSEEELSYEYNEFTFGRAFFHLFLSQSCENTSESELIERYDKHLSESEKLFSKLAPPQSKKMFLSCKNIIISNTTIRSELNESYQVHQQHSIDSRFGRSHFETSESAGDILTQQFHSASPRKKLTGVDLVAAAESPNISQCHSLNEPISVHNDDDIVEQFIPLRVLVVDDAPTALKITSRMLTKIGCEIRSAINGLEALEIVMERTKLNEPWFDAIILDLQMPVMDGIEACQKIRAHETYVMNNLNVNSIYSKKQILIAVSVNADETTKEEASNSGFDFFMPKPFRVEDFEQIMENHHNHNNNHSS